MSDFGAKIVKKITPSFLKEKMLIEKKLKKNEARVFVKFLNYAYLKSLFIILRST